MVIEKGSYQNFLIVPLVRFMTWHTLTRNLKFGARWIHEAWRNIESVNTGLTHLVLIYGDFHYQWRAQFCTIIVWMKWTRPAHFLYFILVLGSLVIEVSTVLMSLYLVRYLILLIHQFLNISIWIEFLIRYHFWILYLTKRSDLYQNIKLEFYAT